MLLLLPCFSNPCSVLLKEACSDNGGQMPWEQWASDKTHSMSAEANSLLSPPQSSCTTSSHFNGLYQCFVCFSPLTTSYIYFTLLLAIFQSTPSVFRLISHLPGSLWIQFISVHQENQLAETWNLLQIDNPSQRTSCHFFQFSVLLKLQLPHTRISIFYSVTY